jgi:hypothetical protein
MTWHSSRFAFRYHLAFMKVGSLSLSRDNDCPPDRRQKNTILRALNNIHTHARELRRDDPRLAAFFEYIEVFCDVLMLHIRGKHAVSWMQLSSLS